MYKLYRIILPCQMPIMIKMNHSYSYPWMLTIAYRCAFYKKCLVTINLWWENRNQKYRPNYLYINEICLFIYVATWPNTGVGHGLALGIRRASWQVQSDTIVPRPINTSRHFTLHTPISHFPLLSFSLLLEFSLLTIAAFSSGTTFLKISID